MVLNVYALRAAVAREDFPEMLKWALIFLVISVIAALSVSPASQSGTKTIAKVLFGLFLVMFVLLLLLAWGAGELVF